MIPHIAPTFEHETRLMREGFRVIAGVDEAGRGAWAGPVTAGAVVLPLTPDCMTALAEVRDSKRLNAHKREKCRALIEMVAIATAVGHATCSEIDELGIVPATRLAMLRAIGALTISPDALIIDAVRLPTLAIRQDVFYFADAISLSVSAASILAKTSRDSIMRQLDAIEPAYKFAAHKGYGTKAHQEALRSYGISPQHRRTYAPIKRIVMNLL